MPKQRKKFKQDPAAAIRSFSKDLLSLKFMQRAKKKIEKVADEKDTPDDPILCPNIKNKQQFIVNPSYYFCERLRFGRLSFKGMNTDIEALMCNHESEKDQSNSEKRTVPPSESDSDNEIVNEVDDLESIDGLDIQ